ncbi:MAG: hypothetical protein KDA92_27130, partial [Planctomycetales bacterium]|nr:hypothetical protein [Planctomycetales bacterium]
FVDQTLILEINVDVHKVSTTGTEPIFAFVSQFEAAQAARLAANRQSALAVTWKSMRFGAVTKAQAGLLRDSVVANVDEFVRDWKSAQAGE